MQPYKKRRFFLACFLAALSTTGCNNTETEPILTAENPEVDACLDNIGQDVIQKSWTAATFPGNDCGVTMSAKGISLNIYSSFYEQNVSDKAYILYRLNQIASQYGYQSYSIILSDNAYKLMIDREVEVHYVQ